MAINKKVSLGRIGFVIEGDFDSTKAYKKLSVVKVPSTGSVYVAREDIPANTNITDSRWYKLLDGNAESSGIFIASAKFDTDERGNIATISTELTKYSVIVNILNDWKEDTNYYNDAELLYIYNQRHNRYIEIQLTHQDYLKDNIIICEINEDNDDSNGIVIPAGKIDRLGTKLENDLVNTIETINNNINTKVTNINNLISKGCLFITDTNENLPNLNLNLPQGYSINFNGSLIFRCPTDGVKKVSINGSNDNYNIVIELGEPLYEGNLYMIYKDNTRHRIMLLYENVKVVNSPAYVSKIDNDEPYSLMINAISNVRNFYSNYQYNFDCVNNEFELDLFSFLANKVDDGFQDITAININNYNKLYLKVRLRMIFHIANYYKHIGVRGGNYKTASNSESGMIGVGSYFSNNVTYPANHLGRGVLNDIPVCLPQFHNYEGLELTALSIPANSKFTIVLLPNLNPVTGEVLTTNVGNCPYSINIWFDDFKAIVNYNNGTIGQMSRVISEQAIIPEQDITKYKDNNPQISNVIING